jgi:DNA (cytosine-5)-methyltransferase 1
MTHLDLFSGIGGFSLGLKRVFNIEHTYFSEIDKYAIDVFKHNFKNSTYVKSVTDVRGAELPRIDIITFGSPCQDFSLAGKREGLGGERSGLITEAIRIIKECRPRFFIWENVKGTFSSNSGADFWAIIQTFTNIGDLNGNCLIQSGFYPKIERESTLSDVLEKEVDDKYFLSQQTIDRLMTYKDQKQTDNQL